MRVSMFGSTGISFSRIEKNLLFERVVATTSHYWQNSAAGLLLKTEMRIGLMKSGSTTEFDTGALATTTNAVIEERLLNGVTNMPEYNLTSFGWANALHFIEEYTGLTVC
jgi:hypothetical protein